MVPCTPPARTNIKEPTAASPPPINAAALEMQLVIRRQICACRSIGAEAQHFYFAEQGPRNRRAQGAVRFSAKLWVRRVVTDNMRLTFVWLTWVAILLVLETRPVGAQILPQSKRDRQRT